MIEKLEFWCITSNRCHLRYIFLCLKHPIAKQLFKSKAHLSPLSPKLMKKLGPFWLLFRVCSQCVIRSPRPSWTQGKAKAREASNHGHGSCCKDEASPAAAGLIGSRLIVIRSLLEGGQVQQEDRRRRWRRRARSPVVSAAAGSRSAALHERLFEHRARLRRGLQLLGASPLRSLQIWVPNLGVQVWSSLSPNICSSWS